MHCSDHRHLHVVQVVLQRAMLLAKCLADGGNLHVWKARYERLLLSSQGEYLQTREGRGLLHEIMNSASPEPPAMWAPDLKQLSVKNVTEFGSVSYITQHAGCTAAQSSLALSASS